MGLKDFGWALEQLRAGHDVTRAGWNGPGQWLQLKHPDKRTGLTLPYIYLCVVQGRLVPWTATQTDLLAEDWEVAP